MIKVDSLSKSFKIHKKDPGFRGTLKSLVSRKFEHKTALKNVSLSVSEGELLGLVGANGAGKTTLVKVLAGIIHPSSGEVSVLGYRPWERKNDFRRQIGLLMGQKAQLWWDLTAADCFLLLKEIYQIPKAQFQSTLDELIETLSVAKLVDVQVRRLSLGERMKMELIASLLHRPKVLFLDEPTLGLDLTSQKAIRKFLLQYVEKYKPAVILTSHYMQDIEELCKRIVIIREGEFVYDGAFSDVSAKYAHQRVITLRSAATDQLQKILAKDFSQLSVDTADEAVKISLPRENVSVFLSTLLQKISIDDISIEEEDIALVIEQLMTKGGGKSALSA